ncbi:hypothetical protein ACROYT_G011984 [Oculina patagonica]
MSISANQTTTPAPARPNPCLQETQRDFILQTAFLILIMVVTFLGNFMVCLIVYLHRRLRTVTNYFIVSLAVSDLLISVLSVPFRIHQTLHNGAFCLASELCWTWLLTDLTCACASICNLAAISVDRYIAIVHPFRYHSLMTTRTGSVIIAIVWTYSVVWAALASFNWTDFGEQHFFTEFECRKTDRIFYTVATTMDFYVPLLVVLVMYGLVFRVAMNQARAVASLQPMSGSTRDGRGRRFSINIVKEVKAAKTLAIVIGAFVVCWFPFFTCLLISLWRIELLRPPRVSEETLKGLRGTFMYVLPTINSTLNPIIYALFNRDFRTAFVRLLQKTFGRSCAGSNGNTSTMDETQYTMNTAATNASPKKKKSKKAQFHEVYGEKDAGTSDEPKHV